jgi:hypothetical protein
MAHDTVSSARIPRDTWYQTGCKPMGKRKAKTSGGVEKRRFIPIIGNKRRKRINSLTHLTKEDSIRARLCVSHRHGFAKMAMLCWRTTHYYELLALVASLLVQFLETEKLQRSPKWLGWNWTKVDSRLQEIRQFPEALSYTHATASRYKELSNAQYWLLC